MFTLSAARDFRRAKRITLVETSPPPQRRIEQHAPCSPQPMSADVKLIGFAAAVGPSARDVGRCR